MKHSHARILLGAIALFVVGAGVLLAPTWLQNYRAGNFVRKHAVVTRQPLGVFEWRDVVSSTPKNYAQTLAALHELGYGTIFVAYNNGAARENPGSYEQKLEAFGLLAKHNGLHVAIVAGDPSWAKVSNFSAVSNVLAFARNYNAAFAQKITAVQFDIEPYTAGADASTTAKELAAVAQYVDSGPSNGIVAVGFTAPFWLASDTHDAQSFLGAVARMSGGFVTIMDYRTHTVGPDGSLTLAAPFFKLVSKSSKAPKLYIAQDSSKTTPTKTTFFGDSSFDLRLAQYQIDQAERNQPSYAGQMVNDVQSLLALKQMGNE